MKLHEFINTRPEQMNKEVFNWLVDNLEAEHKLNMVTIGIDIRSVVGAFLFMLNNIHQYGVPEDLAELMNGEKE